MSNAAPALIQSELVLDRYRPLRPLGSGGSGSVWLARDERNGLDVALKFVPRQGKAASRAEREAEAAARLRHPACQRAYGFGRDSRHVYIAYEYVPGRTFREALRSGELDDAAAIEAAAQVLGGLAHARERGIVHRDVKPSNVLLAEGDDVSVRILDFGLAQIREAGAPPLASLRPDLPSALLTAVDRSLELDPARRPSAAALAARLRRAEPRRRRHGGRDVTGVASAKQVAPPLLAAALAGWTAWAIPFFPSGWPVGLALLAGAATLVRPRVGLAFALAVPVFPLGNLSLGAAILYGAAALAVLFTAWREPESGLLFALGPLLAPVAGLGLLPLAAFGIRSPARRAVQVGAAVLAAGIVAGIRGVPLPFDGSAPPAELGLAASGDPLEVAAALWGALLSRPALAVETVVLATVAVLLPIARARGPWAVAGLGAAFLAAALLVVPAVAAAPLAVA